MIPFRRLVLVVVVALACLSAGRARSGEPARLIVKSEPPGASVVLDGKRLSVKTPVRLTVSPGAHELTLELDGHHPVTRKVEVYQGNAFASFKLHAAGPSSPGEAGTPAREAAEDSGVDAGRPGSAEDDIRFSGPVKIEERKPDNGEEAKSGFDLNNINVLPEDSRLSKLLDDIVGDDDKADPEEREISRPAPEPERVDKRDLFPLLDEESLKEKGADPADDAPAAAGVEERISCLQGDSVLEFDGPITCAPEVEVVWPPSAERLMFAAAADLPRFPERFNILLLGLDRRDARGILATGTPYTPEQLAKKRANADVIMVIQLDFVDKQMRMVSIPRDTKVRYRGSRRRGKINASYAYGWEKMAVGTVEDFLNIKIHRYVTADWRSAKKCITMFKGLGLDYNGFSEKELFWHLRKRSFRRGDFRRIERQQRFLRYAGGEFFRLYNEARLSKGTVGAVKNELVDLAIKQGLDVVKTDMTYDEVQLLAYAFRDYNVRDMTMAQVKGRGGLQESEKYPSGIYFFNPSPKHTFDEIIARVEKDIEKDKKK